MSLAQLSPQLVIFGFLVPIHGHYYSSLLLWVGATAVCLAPPCLSKTYTHLCYVIQQHVLLVLRRVCPVWNRVWTMRVELTRPSQVFCSCSWNPGERAVLKLTLHSGPAEGTIRKKWIFTKTAVIYHILPSWGHWLLYQSIFGEILTNFLVKTVFVAQKLAVLEHFKDWWPE